MKITIIGTGYVGLTAGACFASLGFTVRCIDKDIAKIDALKKGIIPIHEPGLEELTSKTIKSNHLQFYSGLAEVNLNEDCNIIVVAVGTPQLDNGDADLSYINEAVEEISHYLKQDGIIIIKSTVPVGTAELIKTQIAKLNLSIKLDVISNPEFLRQGAAVYDFLNPNRIIIGATSEDARQIAEKIYSPFRNSDIPIIFTNNTTAEIIKYASNSYLATRIAFINELADVCEQVNADIEEVTLGMGYDPRIGRNYLHAGPGFGGSCFPKDTAALEHTFRKYNINCEILSSVINSNNNRKVNIANKIISVLKNENCSNIAVLGVTFKAETDDIRESASLVIIPHLINANFKLKAYDPGYNNQNNKIFADNIIWASNLTECLKEVDAAVIITEWPEFRFIDLTMLKSSLKKGVVYDLRNLFIPLKMKEMGIKYYSIGR